VLDGDPNFPTARGRGNAFNAAVAMLLCLFVIILHGIIGVG